MLAETLRKTAMEVDTKVRNVASQIAREEFESIKRCLESQAQLGKFDHEVYFIDKKRIQEWCEKNSTEFRFVSVELVHELLFDLLSEEGLDMEWSGSPSSSLWVKMRWGKIK